MKTTKTRPLTRKLRNGDELPNKATYKNSTKKKSKTIGNNNTNTEKEKKISIILIVNKGIIYHIIYCNINSDNVAYTCVATRFQLLFWAITTIAAMLSLDGSLLNSQVIFKQF